MYVGAKLKPRQIKLLMFALYKLKKMIAGFEHPKKNFKAKNKNKKDKKENDYISYRLKLHEIMALA